jgi:hypothetical protein
MKGARVGVTLSSRLWESAPSLAPLQSLQVRNLSTIQAASPSGESVNPSGPNRG